MSVSSAEFRDAMSRFGAAVTVVTAGCGDERIGFTATAVCGVSDDPPTLLVCIQRRTGVGRVLRRKDALCVNVLRAGHHSIADVFAGRTGARGAERFRNGDWVTLVTGAPVLASALVSVECHVVEVKEVHSHDIYFACVESVCHGQAGSPLIYYERAYLPANALANQRFSAPDC